MVVFSRRFLCVHGRFYSYSILIFVAAPCTIRVVAARFSKLRLLFLPVRPEFSHLRLVLVYTQQGLSGAVAFGI